MLVLEENVMKPSWFIMAPLICLLIALPVSAGLPGDTSGNDHLERPELAAMVLSALRDGSTIQDARDAAYVYINWNGSPRTITDSSGKERVIWRPFHRIVVMNSETLETMRSIGYNTSTVVGVDKYTLQNTAFFPEFSSTPGIGSIWAPDYEKIVSLKPDAVFLYATVSTSSCDEIEQKLAMTSPDITVLRFDGYMPETYTREIGVLADLFDCTERGGEFLDFYTTNIATVTGRSETIPEGERMKVYFETWNDYKSAAAGSGYDQKIRMAGGSNILKDETAEYPEIDPEAVLQRAPDVVIKLIGSGRYAFGGYDGGDLAQFRQVHDDLIARKGWASLPAVRENRTYVLHTDILGGPHFFIGVQHMARWFYPERFADLNPIRVHEEYLTRYQGLQPTIVDEDIFVYPG